MQYHGRLFVRTDSDRHCFVQTAEPELFHQIKQEAPSLQEWFSTQATRTYCNSSPVTGFPIFCAGTEAQYRSRLAAVGAEVKGIDVRDEILADFYRGCPGRPQVSPNARNKQPTKFG